MSYATSNPPRLIADSVGAGGVTANGGSQGGSLWLYLTTDAFAAIDTAGYFTNGYSLGIRPNDVMIVVKTDTKAAQIMVCIAATSDSDVDFTDGLAVAATNTD